jgi:hydrogenase maturation protein HypF
LAAALRSLRDGKIVAVKGIGGYHLVCDARDPAPGFRASLRDAARR